MPRRSITDVTFTITKEGPEVDKGAAQFDLRGTADVSDPPPSVPYPTEIPAPPSPPALPATRAACAEAMTAKRVEIDKTGAALDARIAELNALIRHHNRLPRAEGDPQ